MSEQGIDAYPAHWEADVVLRDGSTMHVRPIRPDDARALQEMHLGQSEQSVYYRFFAPRGPLSERDLARFTHVDHRDRVALVCMRGPEMRAVGRFDVVEPGIAEVAFYVADAEQGRGLGSILLDHLAAAGRELGLHHFVAEVLPTNARMIRVFEDAGYEVAHTYGDGVIELTISLEETERSWTVMAEREQRAEALSMRRVLGASSLLILGEGELGVPLAQRSAESVLGSPFAGPVHLVGLDVSGASQRVRRWPSLAAVEGPVDLAVLAAHPDLVVDAVPELEALGVGALVVLSGGFAREDATGRDRQRALLRSTRLAGIRLVGPSSFGVVGRGAGGRYDTTLHTAGQDAVGAPWLGLFCQSQPSGLVLRDAAARRGLPVASFLSAGSRADVSGNDTMQHWAADEAVRVGALYLESLGNARKFSRVARRLAARTPLVALTAASTGRSAPPGHPVRVSPLPQRVVHEMLRQAGVLSVDSIPAMLDIAGLLGTQPLPAGPRTSVVATSRVLAAVTADAVREAGLELAGEPVVLPYLAGAPEMAAALAGVRARDDVDAVVVAHSPPLGGTDLAVARAIAQAAAGDPRTWVASVHGLCGLHEALCADGDAVPSTATAREAVLALAAVERYARWRRADRGHLVAPAGVDVTAARRLLARLLVEHDTDLRDGGVVALEPGVVADLLACYGLRVLPARRVTTAAEAVAAAEEIGWPVALKSADLVLRHRTDLGGVRLDLTGPDALREAVEQMAARARAVLRRATEFEVQAMAPPGVACVVAGTEDPVYGPVVSVGLGGDAVELLGDVSYRIPPLTGTDVAEMVRSVRAAPRLFGHRGLPPVDVGALEDVVARVSMLTDDLAEVARVELNPVIVGESGAVTTSAYVELARPVRTDTGRRTLPG